MNDYEYAFSVLKYLENRCNKFIENNELFLVVKHFLPLIIDELQLNKDWIPLLTGVMMYYVYSCIEDIAISSFEYYIMRWLYTFTAFYYNEHEWKNILFYIIWKSQVISILKIQKYCNNYNGWWDEKIL